MSAKNCTKCGELKPLSKFHKGKGSRDGLEFRCKSCAKIEKDTYRHTRSGLIARIYSHQKLSSKTRCHAPPCYTLQELREWCYNNVDFDKLYLNWINSGYNKMKSPSCDRLDDYKSYTLDNLRLVTWQENFDRSHADRKNGINNKLSKAVAQFTLDGEFIAEYHSIRHAARMNKLYDTGIGKACAGNYKKAGGFMWKYV